MVDLRILPQSLDTSSHRFPLLPSCLLCLGADGWRAEVSDEIVPAKRLQRDR